MSNVQKVALKSRPDLDLYVRSLSALDDADLRELIKGKDASTAAGEKSIMSTLLSAYVVDVDGARKFPTPEDAIAFMGTAKTGVCWALIKAGDKFNSLTDESIEAEEKN